MRGDYDRALAEIREANIDRFHIFHAVAAVIYAERGMAEEAAQSGARFTSMYPGFLANLGAELAKRNFRPEDQARLVESLRKAGVSVPAGSAAGCSGLSQPGPDGARQPASPPCGGRPL
jgi:hypothetical protein